MKKVFIKLFCLATLLSACNTSPNYYIDPVAGNDANSGRSADKAWQSLKKVKEITLAPGEQVLLKRGATFNGQL